MRPDDARLSRYRALLQLLRTADQIWNTSRLFFEPWNLSPSQFNVLNLLHDHPHGLSQTELSRQLIMHRSNVTGLIDRLERRGLVQRNDLASDRRAYRVILTARGAAMLQQILPHYYGKADEVWESISTERISQLTVDLKQISNKAELICAEEYQLRHDHPKQQQSRRGS